MKKNIFIAFGILAILGAAYAYYLWNKPHKDMNRASADLTIGAAELMKNYSDSLYLNKTIQVTGIIKEVVNENENISIKLETGDSTAFVSCDLDKFSNQKTKEYQVGERVTMKGICTGQLIDLVIDSCVPVE
jgi:tRNA_anti-like